MAIPAAPIPDPISPHGGSLVDRIADGERRKDLASRAAALPRIQLNLREALDLELIATGAYSPLTGFMGHRDYRDAVESGRLASGVPWTVPITLSLKRGADKVKVGQDVALRAPDSVGGAILGVLRVASLYDYDKAYEAQQVLRAEEIDHPGVDYLQREMGDFLVGGEVWLIERLPRAFPELHAEPRQTRAEFRERGWRRICGFQSGSPMNRAHEYLVRIGIETCDGLLLQALVDGTGQDAIAPAARVRSCAAVVDGYLPKGRVRMAVLAAAARHAGPREAVLQAIVARNFGCTQFIVGPDQASTGGYYGRYDAHAIFDRYPSSELGIIPLRCEGAFHCARCESIASPRSCPHDESSRIAPSGAALRESLRAGWPLPRELFRPEVAQLLAASAIR